MGELQNMCALVTGGSRGIGAAIALRLARDGADVAITFQGSAERASSVAAEITALGRKAVTIQADNGSPADAELAVATTVAALGGLSILVNNAGIAVIGAIEELEVGTIRKVLDVNLLGAILMTRSAIPHMRAGSRIINIGSTAAERMPYLGGAIYSTAKAGLSAFTRAIARDLGARNITANIVHPGSTETDMNPSDGPHAEEWTRAIPLGRRNEPADVAAAVAFLASPEARNISGASLLVDGASNT